jgi:glutamyl-tRNA synthetase
MKVRTRYAVSPTGYQHPGGIRSALYDWLWARHNGGTFILRVEDTDKAREVEGARAYIYEALRWLGLGWDEGPEAGGPHGPYLQSERLDIYRDHARQLAEKGLAYPDPYKTEQVEAFREQAKREKRPFLYRDHRPDKLAEWDGKAPLRFRIPELKKHVWQDAVRGELSAGEEALDDFVIVKGDGYPTYNFAHVVDDHLMEITHVLRGEEFIASTPKFLSLYEAFGWEPPVIGTLPPVLGREGGKKLSKRDGALAILEYRDQGYLPEAVNNFLASLGWNDGTEQEIFSMDELTQKFSLDRVQKSPARFDIERLIWMNGHHLRQLSLDDLCEKSAAFWPPEAGKADAGYKKRVLALTQERLKYLAELPELTRFFFTDLPVDPKLISENKQLKKLEKAELAKLLETTRQEISGSDFSVEDLTGRLNRLLEATGQKPAVLFSLIRIATTQAPASPGLADTLALLGKDTALRRLDLQLKTPD